MRPGYPKWVSEVEPGSTHDIPAAREHALPAFCPAAAAPPTLTDTYTGAGIGIMVPIQRRNLAPDNRARNLLISSLRAPTERGNALLTGTWKAFERIAPRPPGGSARSRPPTSSYSASNDPR